MNGFITLQKGETRSYLFNLNHYLLLLMALVIIIFVTMFVVRQKLKFQKIFVFVSGLLLLALEGLRIFFRYKYLEFNGEPLTFLNVTSLDFFTLSLWVSIPIILVSPFVKKKDKTVFGCGFVFSVSMLSAIISLVYTSGVIEVFPFYHAYNLMFLLLRSIVIYLALIFAISKWTSAEEFLDMYRGVISLLIFGGVCVGVSLVFGLRNNLFYVASCPVFESMGVYLIPPFHFIMLGIFMFFFQMLLFLPFRLHCVIKYRKRG